MPSVATLVNRSRATRTAPDPTIFNTLAAAPDGSQVSKARTWLSRTERLPFDGDIAAFGSFAAVGIFIPGVLVTVDRYPIIAIMCMALSLAAATVWTVFASRVADRARNIRDVTANALEAGVDPVTIRRIVHDSADDIDGFYYHLLVEIERRKS